MKKIILITLMMLFAHSAVAENKWASANDKTHASIVNDQGNIFVVSKSSKNEMYFVFYLKSKNHKIKGFVKNKMKLAEMSFQVDNRAAHDLVGHHNEEKQYIEPLAYHEWLLNELSCGNTLKLSYNTDKGKKTAQFSLKDSTWAISRIEGINFKADCSKKGVMNKKVIKELPTVGAWIQPSNDYSCGITLKNVKKIKMYSSYDKRNYYCSYDKKGRITKYNGGPISEEYFYNKNGMIKKSAVLDGHFSGINVNDRRIERYLIDGYGNTLYSINLSKIESERYKYFKKNDGTYKLEKYKSGKMFYSRKYNKQGYKINSIMKYEFDVDGQYTHINLKKNGEVFSVTMYDKEGKGMKGVIGKVKGNITYQYDYKGNWIKRVFKTNSSNFNSVMTRKITYWR